MYPGDAMVEECALNCHVMFSHNLPVKNVHHPPVIIVCMYLDKSADWDLIALRYETEHLSSSSGSECCQLASPDKISTHSLTTRFSIKIAVFRPPAGSYLIQSAACCVCLRRTRASSLSLDAPPTHWQCRIFAIRSQMFMCTREWLLDNSCIRAYLVVCGGSSFV
jgi:hypothetical protein